MQLVKYPCILSVKPWHKVFYYFYINMAVLRACSKRYHGEPIGSVGCPAVKLCAKTQFFLLLKHKS